MREISTCRQWPTRRIVTCWSEGQLRSCPSPAAISSSGILEHISTVTRRSAWKCSMSYFRGSSRQPCCCPWGKLVSQLMPKLSPAWEGGHLLCPAAFPRGFVLGDKHLDRPWHQVSPSCLTRTRKGFPPPNLPCSFISLLWLGQCRAPADTQTRLPTKWQWCGTCPPARVGLVQGGESPLRPPRPAPGIHQGGLSAPPGFLFLWLCSSKGVMCPAPWML